MLENNNKTRVILPRWIWQKAKDKADFKRLIAKGEFIVVEQCRFLNKEVNS